MILRLLAIGCLTAAAYAQSYATHGDEQLAALVDEALDRNPAVRQSLARYRSALQRIPQVSALPDPVLGITQFAQTPETRVGPQTTMLGISQRFPWFGKLSDQGKVAAKEAASLAEMHEMQKIEVVRRVKLAYWDLSYVDRALQITGEDQTLLEHYETLAQARYSQGMGLQQAVVKLQAEITRDLNRLEVLRRQRVDAEAVLNTVLDRPPETPIARVSLPRHAKTEIDLQRLYAIGRARRPEVRAAFLQIEKNEKRIQLARRRYWPDFTVGAGFTNVNRRGDPAGRMNPPPDNGKNIYSVTVGVNLPIFRRKYDAGVLEATESFLAARESHRDRVNSVEFSIRSVGFRIETIEEQISLFEKALLPQAEQSLRSAEAAYSTGQIGVLDLLDAERFLLEVRLGLVQLLSDYMKALAEMERAIGTPFPEVRP